MNYILFFAYILLSSGGLILFKRGAGSMNLLTFNSGFINLQFSVLALLGIFCYGISFLLYLFLVSKYNLSFIFPMSTGMIYLIILAYSIFILKEHISVWELAGGVLIVLGVILINIKK